MVRRLERLKIAAKGTTHDIKIAEGAVHGDGKTEVQIELAHLVTVSKTVLVF
jgi:hypothetical protein